MLLPQVLLKPAHALAVAPARGVLKPLHVPLRQLEVGLPPVLVHPRYSLELDDLPHLLRLLGEVPQALLELGPHAGDPDGAFARGPQDAVQVPVLLQERGGLLVPDARDARYAVGAVAAQREQVAHLLGVDAPAVPDMPAVHDPGSVWPAV